jgi:hypothetical protein
MKQSLRQYFSAVSRAIAGILSSGKCLDRQYLPTRRVAR